MLCYSQDVPPELILDPEAKKQRGHMKYKKTMLTLGAAAAVVAAILLMRGPATRQVSTSAMSTDVPVSVATAKKQSLASTVSLAGTISANNDVNVISETQGSVRKVHLNVGASVAAGTVLAEVEDEIPRSSLSTAEISYQKAKRDFERSETLFQENSISPAQLDAARLAMKAAENQTEIARRQVENTKIKSPITGTVNAKYVDVGTMVQPGMAVANIVDITTLKVRVNVSEREAFQLKPGDPVEIGTDVYPGRKFQARVDNIASKADEAHTYPVEIRLSNSGKYPLKAGMFCRIGFTSITATEALAVPRITLVGSVKNAAVYVVRNGVASLQPIVVGKQTNEFFEVLNGLNIGDTVVVSGQNNLVDNTRVVIVVSD
ncbi:MAG TPA: efflux RND transporter periplasmic adaptor subunit [Bacteroidota bacterium]